MVILADRLVALREVVALLHLDAFEARSLRRSRDLEFRRLHGDLHDVHGFVVRLHVFVGQRTARMILAAACLCFFEEAPVRGRIEWALEDRDVAFDPDESRRSAALRSKWSAR